MKSAVVHRYWTCDYPKCAAREATTNDVKPPMGWLVVSTDGWTEQAYPTMRWPAGWAPSVARARTFCEKHNRKIMAVLTGREPPKRSTVK